MQNLISVKRANVILDIDPELKAQYLREGYSVLDENGNVVEKAMSTDVGELQVTVAKLEKENEELKAEIKKLKTKTQKNVTTE